MTQIRRIHTLNASSKFINSGNLVQAAQAADKATATAIVMRFADEVWDAAIRAALGAAFALAQPSGKIDWGELDDALGNPKTPISKSSDLRANP